MNRVKFVKNLKHDAKNDLFSHFRNAFLSCLSPEEVCNSLDLNFIQSSGLRQSILDKICQSMDSEFLNCHEQLLGTLLELMTQDKCPNRSSIASYLDKIADVAPQEFKEKIIKIFLDSALISFRKRGCNLLFRHWNSEFEAQIAMIWHRNRDIRASELIIEKFPTEFLELHFLELESQLNGHYKKRTLLYKRTYPSSKNHLVKLAQEDGITYVYVCVEIGVVLSEYEARQLAHRYATDKRIGILIWGFGIMKHWDVIAEIYRTVSGNRTM
ncbi:MAG: hypothetical protein PHN45_02505 [Methylococcales bacterium]|nr:hypothetical protein [Methylococcales bacterium]MDD5753605.1 hypothetical protein [Methylococcales bacterium]